MRVRAAVLILAAAACHPPAPPAPTTGAITGLVRDEDTGTALPRAQLAIRKDGALSPALVTTDDEGAYQIERLPPGRYDVTASYAGVTVDERAVIVSAGHATAVDLDLALGRPETHHIDFGDPHGTATCATTARRTPIRRRARSRAPSPTGAVTHERVAGAVVTATSPALAQAVQVITDDRGRFTVPDVPPGQYSVSAYYEIAHHGTISVEHNLIQVAGGETAVVPLFVETER